MKSALGLNIFSLRVRVRAFEAKLETSESMAED
jgi:hypothetical protein